MIVAGDEVMDTLTGDRPWQVSVVTHQILVIVAAVELGLESTDLVRCRRNYEVARRLHRGRHVFEKRYQCPYHLGACLAGQLMELCVQSATVRVRVRVLSVCVRGGWAERKREDEREREDEGSQGDREKESSAVPSHSTRF